MYVIVREYPPSIYIGACIVRKLKNAAKSVQKIPFLKFFNCHYSWKGGRKWGEI